MPNSEGTHNLMSDMSAGQVPNYILGENKPTIPTVPSTEDGAIASEQQASPIMLPVEQSTESIPVPVEQPTEPIQVPVTEMPTPAEPAPRAPETTNPNNQIAFQPGAYKIEWKGSPNFWYGRAGQSAIAIVDHIMQGTMESTNGWFKSRRSEASTHFGVARDGRIWQWVEVENTAWANGVMQNPDPSVAWLAECRNENINPNTRTISIEHEGYSGKPFTEEQYQATLWLHKYLCVTYNIAPDREQIVGHYQIQARDRAGCPGATFPWERLMNELTSAVNLPPPAPAPDYDPSKNKWARDVPMVTWVRFGPGTVNSNNAFVRSRPSLSITDKSLVRVLNRGKMVRFIAYTDAGPVFKSGVRWYLIADEDGGGWIHSMMIS
jgi:N-acetyl-anhydromuramyl-L-alanine amidase AmpD